MKPIKSALGISVWLLRLSFLFLVLVTFGEEVIAFEYRSREFIVAAIFVLLSVLIFLGGFSSKPTLTVLPGLLICLLSLYTIAMQVMNGFNASLATLFVFCTLGFFFACKGTNK
ncbi:MAG: hypothetical protein WHT29_02560 [Bacteroidales bacterium]|nr:hypothetical protein [Bacteroidales bacterium]HOK97887.1 hypothetical protein [Bacteroidales bacterium]HPO64652.1 hypothetical protein [Bacteroidales bacterium]